MNKREAKKLAEQDTTPYGVLKRERGQQALYKVTGYRNAKIIAGRDASTVILTASEMRKAGLA